MDMALDPAVDLDYRNAHYLAVASLLVYERRDDVHREEFARQLGLRAEGFEAGNTQASVGLSDEHVVVAFRGTESPFTADGRKDWLLSNARQQLIEPPEGNFGADFAAAGAGARFHEGFLSSLAAVWDKFYPVVEDALNARERPVWVTGHSLGGALATLAAWRLRRLGIPVHKLYTFAAPMLCNLDAANAYLIRLGNRIYRFVNADDIIPLLPISSLLANEYLHVGTKEVLRGEHADVPGAEAVIDRIRFLAEALLAPLLASTTTSVLWKEFQRRHLAHSLAKGYINRIIERRRELEGP